jgi:histone demethylase JARID1
MARKAHEEEQDDETTPEFYQKIEKEYWDKVDNQIGENKIVEYAADLATNKFGSGFGTRNQKILDPTQKDYVDHPWNMNNYHKHFGSLMSFKETADMSGIDIPWSYIGMKFSTFCWHFEDLMLYSINYQHYGKPKLWYGIPQ